MAETDRFSSNNEEPHDYAICECSHRRFDHAWEIGSEDTPCEACSCLRFVGKMCRRCRIPAGVSGDHDPRCTWHPRNRWAGGAA